MRNIRLIAIVVGVVLLALLFVSLLVTGKPAPVAFLSHGRSRSDDGSVSYLVTVTNRTTEPLDVEVMRNNAPTGMIGFAFRVHTTMPATSVWHALLYPPPEGVRWSASVRYLRRTGPIETRLRQIGAWLRLSKPNPQWEVAETIEIPR
jgi:hypothetical protein